MMNLRSLRIPGIILSVLLVFALVGCKTTQDDQDQTDQLQPGTAIDKEVSALDADIEEARAAVRRANLVGANKYFPSDYRQLVDELNSAVAMKDADQTEARSALRMVVENANKLYSKSLLALREDYEKRYFHADEALKRLNADKFAPQEYTHIQELAVEALDLYESDELLEAQTKADKVLIAQSRLYHNLSENIRYFGILRRDTENYLGDAEDNEAFLYSPDELESANTHYLDGISAYRSYDIAASVDLLSEAKRLAVVAARTSAIRKSQAETDQLLLQTQNRIEVASQLRVQGTDGSLQEARPWGGNEYLSRNPLIDHSQNLDPIDIEDPVLRALDEPVENESEGIPLDIPITDSDTLVNADEENVDYFAVATSLWEKGVTARNAGQFDLAQTYFKQAQAYIDAYESNAVSQTYTVVYRERGLEDCLWRISEMAQIYNNPFLWPKIWRANRRIIQNPDLIYPGQILTIPPP